MKTFTEREKNLTKEYIVSNISADFDGTLEELLDDINLDGSVDSTWKLSRGRVGHLVVKKETITSFELDICNQDLTKDKVLKKIRGLLVDEPFVITNIGDNNASQHIIKCQGDDIITIYYEECKGDYRMFLADGQTSSELNKCCIVLAGPREIKDIEEEEFFNLWDKDSLSCNVGELIDLLKKHHNSLPKEIQDHIQYIV